VSEIRNEFDDGIHPEDESVGDENDETTFDVQVTPLKHRLRINNLFEDPTRKPSCRMAV